MLTLNSDTVVCQNFARFAKIAFSSGPRHTAPCGDCPAIAEWTPLPLALPPPPGVHKTGSEEDMLIFGQKVHVHGQLAKHEVHPPQVKLGLEAGKSAGPRMQPVPRRRSRRGMHS